MNDADSIAGKLIPPLTNPFHAAPSAVFRKVLAGHGGGVFRQVVGGVVIHHGLTGFVGTAEGSQEAFADHDKGPIVGHCMRPFVAQHVGQADVASLNQIGELGTGDGRDVNVALIPVVTAPRRGDPIDLDFIEPLVPEPERFQITGARVVGAADILIADGVPARLARGFPLIGHDGKRLENSRRKASRRQEFSQVSTDGSELARPHLRWLGWEGSSWPTI